MLAKTGGAIQWYGMPTMVLAMMALGHARDIILAPILGHRHAWLAQTAMIVATAHRPGRAIIMHKAK